MNSQTVTTALEQVEVCCSSPCRIDPSGGTWDLKALALPYHSVLPSTVTVSLDLRASVRLHPFEPGWVRVTDGTADERVLFREMSFRGGFGLVYALVAFFGFDGLAVAIDLAFPKFSGLGGSGVLAVATLSALNEVPSQHGRRRLQRHEIVEVAHDLEDGMGFSYTGMQDQASAAYGGVNRWLWNYRRPGRRFERGRLLSHGDYPELEARLVVAYLGIGHESAEVNQAQVGSFYDGRLRHNWMRIREITDGFAEAIGQKDWGAAIALLQEEHDLRCSMVGQRNTALGRDLEAIATNLGCGFAAAGAGGGGCVYALCRTADSAAELARRWQAALAGIPNARLLPCTIARQGTVVSKRKR